MKEYARLILILLIPLLMVSAYSLSGHRIAFNGWTVAKARAWEKVLADVLSEDSLPSSVSGEACASLCPDTLSPVMEEKADTVFSPDTCRKNILFFGDSMVEGLSMRFADYARENGHSLYSVCWYGSSTYAWASNPDTLQSFLRWSEADYVVVSLGGNELKVKDLENRAAYIRTIQSQLGSRPTVWIAPPSWVKNPTITEVIRSVVGDRRYFDSTRLTFTRGSDKMHPTFNSASKWMDSIAVWMASPETAHPIVMDVPVQKYPRKWKKRFMFPNKTM